LDRIIHVRRNALDERDLILDGNRIRHNQCFGVMRPRAHAVHRAPPCLNPYKIIPKIIQLLLDASLPRLADSHNANDRCDPDGDAQDRQNAPQLVSKQRYKG